MKIKNTTLQMIKGDSKKIKAALIVKDLTTSQNADQDVIRNIANSALTQVRRKKLKSIVFPAIGVARGFPVIGSAKIIIQEVLKFFRDDPKTLQKIIFCLPDDESLSIFDHTIRGYVKHIQVDLGSGPYCTCDIIIELKEGIVLIERSNPPYGWALPGGFLDYGESLEHAAIREAKEETSLDLVDLRQFHTYSEPSRDPRFHTVTTVFIAKGKGTPQAGDDAKAFKIVKYADLLKLDYAFDHNQVIKDYLKVRGKKNVRKN